MGNLPNLDQHLFVAVDPLAIALPGEVYQRLTKKPKTPEDYKASIRQLVRELTPQQREQVTAHTQQVLEVVRLVEAEVGNTLKPGQAEVRAR